MARLILLSRPIVLTVAVLVSSVLCWCVVDVAESWSFPMGGSTTRRFLSRFRPRRDKNNNNNAMLVDNVHNNLITRRTINEFEDELPSHWQDALTRAVVAATYAPNHKRTEPWRFHLLGKDATTRVCELNAQLVAEQKGPEAGQKKLERWLKMPGWLVVTCSTGHTIKKKKKQGDGEDGDKEGDDFDMNYPMGVMREDYAACCCAVQNLCLSLHSQGIGTKWTTGAVNFHPYFATIVGFDPSDEYVVGTLWFGTPKKNGGSSHTTTSPPPPKKLSLDDVLIRHD